MQRNPSNPTAVAFRSANVAFRSAKGRLIGAALCLAIVALLCPRSAPAAEPTAGGQVEPRSGYRLAPRAFRVAVQKVLPSLVTIETFGGVSTTRSGSKRGQMSGISKPGDGPTTGLIVSPDGYILTSTFNFIKKQPVITVVLPDGSQKVAQLLGRDETRKICLLKVEGVKDLPVPEWLPRNELKVGQWAVSVGVGFGDEEPAMSTGIISATSRIFGRAVQTDANISPANYGGPLVNIEGKVIGLCVPLSPQSQSLAAGVEWYDSGIGFAIPLHGTEQLINQLKEGKTIQPGKLGVQLKAAGPKGGAVVGGVAPNSPASKVGIKVGDEVLKVGDEKVLDLTHLRSLIGRYDAGQEVSVTLKRGNDELTIVAKLEAGLDQPENPAKPAANPDADPKPGEPKPEPPKPADPPKPEEKKADDKKPDDKKPEDKKPEDKKPDEPAKPEAPKPEPPKPAEEKPAEKPAEK